MTLDAVTAAVHQLAPRLKSELGVAALYVFGSVARGEARADSDVDVLVEFEPDHVPGFIALHDMEAEFSQLVGGRKVDLVTERFLNRRIRDRALATAEPQYAAG